MTTTALPTFSSLPLRERLAIIAAAVTNRGVAQRVASLGHRVTYQTWRVSRSGRIVCTRSVDRLGGQSSNRDPWATPPVR